MQELKNISYYIKLLYKYIIYTALCFISLDALANDNEYILIIKEHRFIPDRLVIPANKKVKLIIDNQDNEAEEFESFDLRREKIVPSNSKIKVKVGPLDPGEYKFFGEFHIKTAQGVIIVE